LQYDYAVADPLEEIRRLAKFDDDLPLKVERATDRLNAQTGKAAIGKTAAAKGKPIAKYQPAAIGLWPLLGTLAAICLLWTTPVVYPIKLLVVFFHELSHAIMAVLTGGRVTAINLDPMQGGVTYTLGGNGFLTAGAGYLGSLLWGGAILSAATRLRHPRIVTGVLAGILLLVSLFWIRPMVSFGMLFSLLAGAGLLATSLRVPDRVNAFLLQVIGLTSLLYVPLDILEDTVLNSAQLSDARILAQMTLIPTVVWGGLWTGLSMAAGWWFLRKAVAAPSDAQKVRRSG
jgi:hypothetical protein